MVHKTNLRPCFRLPHARARARGSPGVDNGVLAPLAAASVPGTAGAAAVIAAVLCAAAGPAAEASAIRRSTLPMASVIVLAMPPPNERCGLLTATGRLLTNTAADTQSAHHYLATRRIEWSIDGSLRKRRTVATSFMLSEVVSVPDA